MPNKKFPKKLLQCVVKFHKVKYHLCNHMPKKMRQGASPCFGIEVKKRIERKLYEPPPLATPTKPVFGDISDVEKFVHVYFPLLAGALPYRSYRGRCS